MKKVLILGANGRIARLVEERIPADWEVTLFLRKADRLQSLVKNHPQFTLFEGDASDLLALSAAMKGMDIVYANLSGENIVAQGKNIILAMNEQKVKTLIWISTLGIYDEVPGNFGKWNHKMLDGTYLDTYSQAAKVIENSSLNWTIIRPAWLTDKDEVDYELTEKGEAFKGTEVSRKSIADLVIKIIENPENYTHHSLGVNKENTDGDKPSWY